MTIEQWLGKDNQLGIDIWEKKYRYGNESFDEWLDRVSGGNPEVKKLIKEKKFLFGGRILASRGVQNVDPDAKVVYSNCFVLSPPEDNLDSIFDCAKKMAVTFSRGGGVGVDLSKLAPKGAKVRNAAKESSGAVSFMDLYSQVTGLISQNGRRGALMLSLSCDHPDIEEFIDIKKDLDRVTKANISVRVTDEFMRAAVENRDVELSFTRDATGETITKTVNARDLMMKLAYNNWDMGEPGILFWDRIESWNLLSEYDDFEFSGVNPCAEEPLPSGGACLLGSLNLAEFVSEGGRFDFPAFEEAVRISVVALNEVLDEGMPLLPLEEQRQSVSDWRQIGLGVFGLADMLIKMGVKYGSSASLDICYDIGLTMWDMAVQTSATLASIHGAYPKYRQNPTIMSSMLQIASTSEAIEMVKKHGLRNSQLLTIAPTGTLSTMLGVSGGVEPIFANYYERKTESLHGEDVYYKVYTPIVKEYMVRTGITEPDDLPDYFITAKDIDYHDRVGMQSIWQRYIDASISSTVNLPVDATPKDVFDIYVDAWDRGLKGITVFRDGCRRAGILTTNISHEDEDERLDDETPPRGYIIETSDNVVGKKRKLITGCGSLHVAAFFDPETGDLMETYLSKGSTGGCQNFMIGLSRMISLAARSGSGIHAIIDQLNSCGVCPSYAVRRATKHDTSPGSCCPIAVGNALMEMWKETQLEIEHGQTKKTTKEKGPSSDAAKADSKIVCPECGEAVVHEGGCDICKNCGYSKCS